MKKFIFFVTLIAFAQTGFSAIWRVNNNPGVNANFTDINLAIASASVQSGDTIHVEPSLTNYSVGTLNKSLKIFGVGYLLDSANTTTPGNAGLVVTTFGASVNGFTIDVAGAGSVISGCRFTGGITINSSVSPQNILFERCYLLGSITLNGLNHSNITLRKCLFDNAGVTASTAGGTVVNFTFENNIIVNPFAVVNVPNLSGSNNVFRNNSSYGGSFGYTLPNCYVANNIFGMSAQSVFTNALVKNNLFQVAQTLGPTATNNQQSVVMANVYVLGTGSFDGRLMLKVASPAIGAGLTVGSVVSPDCGAYGATDPYRQSGIPAIPSIYLLTVPVSIPSGSPTMNVTFSTRNNN